MIAFVLNYFEKGTPATYRTIEHFLDFEMSMTS
jgi:hypothetical protein